MRYENDGVLDEEVYKFLEEKAEFWDNELGLFNILQPHKRVPRYITDMETG